MTLYVNCFREGGALLETQPQGDASTPVQLPPEQAELVAGLLTTPEVSATLAKVFLAGVRAGERSVRGNGSHLREAIEDHLEWMETGKVDGVGFDEASAAQALRAAIVKSRGQGPAAWER